MPATTNKYFLINCFSKLKVISLKILAFCYKVKMDEYYIYLAIDFTPFV